MGPPAPPCARTDGAAGRSAGRFVVCSTAGRAGARRGEGRAGPGMRVDAREAGSRGSSATSRWETTHIRIMAISGALEARLETQIPYGRRQDGLQGLTGGRQARASRRHARHGSGTSTISSGRSARKPTPRSYGSADGSGKATEVRERARRQIAPDLIKQSNQSLKAQCLRSENR